MKESAVNDAASSAAPAPRVASPPHDNTGSLASASSSQAVDAHADDRDVIVLQLEGAKDWRVFGPPPVAFPTHDEQVGKGGRAVPPEALDDAHVVLQTTLKQGDVLYIPRGFVHEASTASEAASLHLTLALPSADWSWASVAASAASKPELEASLRAKASEEWFWRRAIPPALACPGGLCSHRSRSVSRAQVLRKSASVEAELGLAAGALERQLAERAAAHNARQAEALAGLQAKLAKAPAYASPSAFVRRRREDEPAPPRAAAPADEGGLRARAEIADALVQALSELSATRFVRISSVCDAPLLCPFSKACFAHVCVGSGLLVLQPSLLPPSVPLDVAERVDHFHHALVDIERDVQRLLARPWSEVCPADAPPLERARLHLTTAYTANSLYWMYLRTKGARPQEMQPIKAELVRIQKYLAKVKAAEAAAAAPAPAAPPPAEISHEEVPAAKRAKAGEQTTSPGPTASSPGGGKGNGVASASGHASGKKKKKGKGR